MTDERSLRGEERAVLALRALYRRFGYARYKMSKFEEYDLYARNKSFLVSEEIITFTGAGGRLMALKPDVTLSIVKNSRDEPGVVQKLYYDERVYRMSRGAGEFREILQTGLECIGDVSDYHICEVLHLAAESLRLIHGDWALDVSHAGLVWALLADCGAGEELGERILSCIRSKSPDAAAALPGMDGRMTELSRRLSATYRDFAGAQAALADYVRSPESRAAMAELGRVCAALTALGHGDRTGVDFSIANHMDYYSGVVFKGYIRGIPVSVLSGGQYDRLMRRLGRGSGAIGFAVYLDELERFQRQREDVDTDIVLLRTEADDPAALLRAAERLSAGGESVAVLPALPADYLCRRVYRLTGGELTEWK